MAKKKAAPPARAAAGDDPRPAEAPPAADDDPLRAEAAATVANPDKIGARELADRLADPAFLARVEEAVENLPPEKAAELVALLEASVRRRKIELIGYLAAAGVLLVGMVVSLYAFGAAAEGEFIGWVFMIPLALAGLVMIVVGRLARRAEAADRARRARTEQPAPPAPRAPPAPPAPRPPR